MKNQLVTDNVDNAARVIAMNMLGVPLACPECGAQWSDQVARSFVSGDRCKCVKCGFYGNWRCGTVLNGRHIKDSQFVVLFSAFSLFRNPSPADLKAVAKQMEMSVEYVKEWRARINAYLQSREAA